MKKLYLLLILIALTFLGSCQQKKYDIVATLFPQYQISKEIVGDKLSVSLLMAPGADPHHFEPSSKNMIEIINSSLFIYTSDQMEPWIKEIEKGKGTYMNLYDEIKLIDENISDDVHFFMSIDYQINMIDIILNEITSIDFSNTLYYQANAQTLKEKLLTTKENYLSLDNQNFYFIGHNVFKSFTKQTNITFISLLDEFTDETNPSSSEIEKMFNNLMENNIKFLYYDSVTGAKMALNFQKDLKKLSYDIEVLPINTFHTISKEDFNSITSINDLWTENYNNLKRGILWF